MSAVMLKQVNPENTLRIGSKPSVLRYWRCVHCHVQQLQHSTHAGFFKQEAAAGLRSLGWGFSWQQGALSCCRVDPADRPSAAGSWRLRPPSCGCNRSPASTKPGEVSLSEQVWNWYLYQVKGAGHHVGTNSLCVRVKRGDLKSSHVCVFARSWS